MSTHWFSSALYSVRDSGELTCTAINPITGKFDLNIVGLDTSLTTTPSRLPNTWSPDHIEPNYRGSVISLDKNYFGSYYVYIWVPEDTIKNYGIADGIGGYTLSTRNTITGSGGVVWDPVSISGLSNYGAGTESTLDNFVDRSYNWTDPGDMSAIVSWEDEAHNYKTCSKRKLFPGQKANFWVRWDRYVPFETDTTVIQCAKTDPTYAKFTGNVTYEVNPPTKPVQLFTSTWPVGSMGPHAGMYDYVPLYANNVGITPIIEYSTTPLAPNLRDDTNCGDGS
jgi:hypothetical protein